MFIYIFEYVGTYDKSKIDEYYCKLFYDDELDYIDQDIEMIQNSLVTITQKIFENKRFLSRV